MALKITRPSELRKKNIKMIVYGRSGRGKTFFSTSSVHRKKENALKTLVIDLESGTTAVPNNDIDVFTVKTPAEFKMALLELKKENPYELIVVSSWTKYSEMLYLAAKEIAKAEEEESGKKNQFRIWNIVDEKFREYYDMLLQLDSHLIIECLEEISEIEGHGIINYPMMKARLFKQYMPSQSDITVYITMADGEPLFVTEQYPRAFTKNRFEHSHPKIKRFKRDNELWNAENLIKYIQS